MGGNVEIVKRANRELKGLRRFSNKAWIGGVCAGLSYRMGVPLWSLRMFWAFTVLLYGIGIVPYLALWVFLPKAKAAPADYEERTGDPDGDDWL